MRIFGPTPWGPAVDDASLMTSTPVGAVCLLCEQPIAATDSGLVTPCVEGSNASGTLVMVAHRAQHRACFLDSLGIG